MKLQFVLTLIVLVSAVQCKVHTSVVDTDIGPTRGRFFYTYYQLKKYSGFFGLPYAKSPIGDLRFADPVEHPGWTDVFNATETGPICPQYVLSGIFGQEDCLTLNVYTPAVEFPHRDKLYPVMVWIYGGGFIFGTNIKDIYGPDLLIEENVVVVIMNYRMSALGFFSLGVDGADGNQGLKDQALALKWVQKHIDKFGGDPNQVTVFGESSGAACVGYHLISPLSRGLFSKAILQSGSPLCTWAYQTKTDAHLKARELARILEIYDTDPSEILSKLKEVNMTKLMTAAATMLVQITPFLPTVESVNPERAIITDCPSSYFESGNVAPVPILMGYNQDEAMLFTSVLDDLRQILVNTLIVPASTAGLDVVGNIGQIKNFMFDASYKKLTDIASSFFFESPIDLTQQLLAKRGDEYPVFYYKLRYSAPDNLHILVDPLMNGTSHGDDVFLFFHANLISTISPDNDITIQRKKFVKLWTTFAKQGNPTNPPDQFSSNWENSGSEGKQMLLDPDNFHMVPRQISTESVTLVQKPYHSILPALQACESSIVSKLNFV
ncbi:Acetylcholinesterase [Dufourea novaeangliae]|uniref:Carboxylic ester hydrolase n=1 Tax=Dufourea novaeangliae TaxID=178035 RepID=A0A154NZ10_DUFNO|nr:Acetylcholinesterase [Dufourea novaeangliae]